MTRRWICPRCSDGQNASSRPRMDDVRRYCLPCSEKTGRLVERTCPAHDRAKVGRKERQAAKLAAQRERIEQREEASKLEAARLRSMGLPVPWPARKAELEALVEQWKRLPVWKCNLSNVKVSIAHRSRPHSTGISYGGWCTITVGQDEADAKATLLHELAHEANFLANRRSRRSRLEGHMLSKTRDPWTRAHGVGWRGFFFLAAEAVTGKRPVIADGDNTKHGVHHAVVAVFANSVR